MLWLPAGTVLWSHEQIMDCNHWPAEEACQRLRKLGQLCLVLVHQNGVKTWPVHRPSQQMRAQLHDCPLAVHHSMHFVHGQIQVEELFRKHARAFVQDKRLQQTTNLTRPTLAIPLWSEA